MRLGTALLLSYSIMGFSLAWSLQDTESLKKCFKKQASAHGEAWCDANGKMRLHKNFFSHKPEQPSVILSFNEDERLTSYSSYSIDGDRVIHTLYTPENDGTYIAMHDGRPVARYEIDVFPRYKTQKIATWSYHKNGNLDFTEDFRDTNLESWPKKVAVYNKETGKRQWVYDLSYRTNKRGIVVISDFKLYDDQGQLIGAYSEDPKTIPKAVESPYKRTPVVIIDTGFDISHPQLRNHFSTRFAGEYDDPAFGRESDHRIHDSIIPSANRTPAYPFSHGTHVASIAFQSITQFEAVGFAGDFSGVAFLERMSNFIKKNKVPFVNMSFGFGERDNPFGADEKARDAIYRLMRDNSETLFIIAAGNGNPGQPVTSDLISDWPAGIPLKNKIVVAATTDSKQPSREMLKKAKLTFFSNFGPEVDLAAPGDDVLGANIGGTQVAVSGTSMASPYVMNVAMRMKEVNPKLTALQVRDLMLRSVVIPDQPLPVKTKGVLDIELALKNAVEAGSL